MAATALIAFTTGSDVSSDQSVGAGEVHTIIPITHGRPGKVVVQLKTSEDTYAHLKTLTFRDKDWQLQGPAEYRVRVRNAGCDVDAGA